jgi:hypothetical protein
MFYLNRSGVPEGPFSEAQILALIQSGGLVHASICPVGHQHWLPLGQHPPFAQALAYAQHAAHSPAGPTAPGGPPPGYGPPTAAPGYGPPAGYGAPPQHAAHGHAHGQHAQHPQPAVVKKKSGSKAGLLIGLFALFLALVGGAAAAVYFFFLGGRAPDIARAVPRDTEILVEIPNIKRMGLDALGMDFLEPAAADEQKNVEELTQAVAKAFDIPQEDGIDFLVAADSAGIAGRITKTSGGAVVLGFARSGAVEGLLASKRFREVGVIGAGGKRYQLDRKADPIPPVSEPVAHGLSNLEIRERPTLAWFPDARLLIGGDEAFITAMAKVFEEEAPSLADEARYGEVREQLGDDARIRGYVDLPSLTADLAVREKDLVDGYFKAHGPLSGAVRFKDPGILMELNAKISGAKYPAQIPPPIALDLAGRLPKETLAYAAMSSKSPLTGAQLRAELLTQMRAISPEHAALAEQRLVEVEKTFGTSVDALADATGEQVAFGVAMPDTFIVDPLKGEQNLTALAAYAVIALKDEKPYRSLLTQLKTQLGPAAAMYEIAEDPTGITLRPRAAPIPIGGFARFTPGYLMIAGGSPDLTERAFKAFSAKDGTLADSAAHKAAMSVLPEKSQFVVFLDAGRLGSSIMDSPLVKLQLTATGVDLSKFKLKGDQRVTAALAASAEIGADKVWTWRVTALNAPALGAFGAASVLGTRSAFTPPTPPAFPPGFAPGQPFAPRP